jgi:hypothetical protein
MLSIPAHVSVLKEKLSETSVNNCEYQQLFDKTPVFVLVAAQSYKLAPDDTPIIFADPNKTSVVVRAVSKGKPYNKFMLVASTLHILVRVHDEVFIWMLFSDLSDYYKCATQSCGGKVKLRVCAKCRVLRFCDRKCQKAQWKQHKEECSVLVAESQDGKPPFHFETPWPADIARKKPGFPMKSILAQRSTGRWQKKK